MLTITVAQDWAAVTSHPIAEVVLAVPDEEEALVQVGPGLYREADLREALHHPAGGWRRPDTARVGRRRKAAHKDGCPTHTFRSYTAFFSGGTLCVEDMTIENDAGPGAQAGQAVAAYVDSARAVFRRVKLLGNQDTLFCARCPKRSGRRTASSARGALRPAARRPSTIPNARSRGTSISSSAAETRCSRTAPSAPWTTTSPTAMSPPRRAKPTGWASCSGTAISFPTARRAASIWAVRGVPRGRRQCWTAASVPTSPRKASSRGTTARTPVSPTSPRPTAPARARQSVRRGCVPSPAGGGGAAGPRRPLPPGMTEDVTDEKTA